MASVEEPDHHWAVRITADLYHVCDRRVDLRDTL